MFKLRDQETDRKCTNLSSLISCIGFVILLFVLVLYSGINGDINRLTKGYDDCGNICGLENRDNIFNQCGDNDKRQLPKVLVDTKDPIEHFSCVEKCPETHKEVLNRCWQLIDGDSIKVLQGLQEIPQQLYLTYPHIAAVCFVAFIFSYILLLLFRYAIHYAIWIINIAFIIAISFGATFLWVKYAETLDTFRQENAPALLALAISFTVIAIVSIVLLICLRNRIRLIAQLFKEASKALIDLPSIMFEPILTFIALVIAFGFFVYFDIVIETAGTLKASEHTDGSFKAIFEEDNGIIFARLINIVAFIWFSQFIIGCQHFVISGTISKWYFTRDKTKLEAPIRKTFSHLFFFHLGSICLGSMILTAIKIIKIIVAAIRSQMHNSRNPIGYLISCLCSWFVQWLDEIFKFFARNAYILVSLDGTPFLQSGRNAFGLILRNVLDVIALNQFGDVVLILGRLFVVVIAGIFGYEIMNPILGNVTFVMILTIIFSFLIAHCFVSVFEITVDTILLCFCRDCEENDGVSTPYFMSVELMQIMNELKETTGGSFNFKQLNNSQGGEGQHQMLPTATA